MLRVKQVLCGFCFLFAVIACGNDSSPSSRTKSSAQADWHLFRGNAGLTGTSEAILPEKLKQIWRFETGNEVKSSPVINNGIVYIGSSDGKLYALHLEDGSELWHFDAEDDIEAAPLFHNDMIYVGSLSGYFFALDAQTGMKKWEFETEGQISGAANLMINTETGTAMVLVGSYDNFLYSFDASSGELNWKYEAENYINGSPATDGKVVIFGGCDEKLHILDVTNGKKQGEVETGSYIAGSAALLDTYAYLGHYGQQVLAINVEEQRVLWRYEPEEKARAFFSSPAVTGNSVIIGSRDNLVHCIDRGSGKTRWTFRTRDHVDSSPLVCGNRVVAGSMDGWLYILDIANGALVWSYEIGGSIIGSPGIAGGKIVIGSDDGSIYAFGEDL